MSQTRQLAAILFTDISGFTSLVENDEQKAPFILKKYRDLQNPFIDPFIGSRIKDPGDGVLASFPTVSDALNAAVNIQEQGKATKDFQLSIGIHQGETVLAGKVESGQLFIYTQK